jgi:hypothetical protein
MFYVSSMANGIGDLLFIGLDTRLPLSKRLDIVPSIVVIVYRTILMGGMVTTFSLFTFCDLYRFEGIPNVVNFLGITSS